MHTGLVVRVSLHLSSAFTISNKVSTRIVNKDADHLKVEKPAAFVTYILFEEQKVGKGKQGDRPSEISCLSLLNALPCLIPSVLSLSLPESPAIRMSDEKVNILCACRMCAHIRAPRQRKASQTRIRLG